MRLIDRMSARSLAYLPENESSFSTWYKQTYEGVNSEERVLQTFQDYVNQGYLANGVVFAVILRRAMLFSEATFKFRDLATKKLYGTEALKTLETPWPNGTTGELLVRMIQDADMAGNAFIRNDGDRLVRMRPDWVNIVMKGGGPDDPSRWDVVGYTYRPYGASGNASDPNTGVMDFYPVDEVSHWSPIPDPLAQYRGISWMTPVVKEINADKAMTEYKRRFMDNNATPNLLVKYSQTLSAAGMKRARETWNARYGGTDGLKTAILDSGADVVPIGSPFSALDFTNVQAAGENRIAVAGGVPGIVLGLKEGLDASTYSNYQQAMRAMADLTARPLWRSACAALAKLVTVPDGAELWYDTSDISALREGEQDRAATLQTLGIAAAAYINAGYVPETVTKALIAGDLNLLQHSGRVSVQLYDPSAVPDQTQKAQPDGPAIANTSKESK